MVKAAWVVAAFATAAGSAAQAETLRWQMRQSPDGVVLAYEQPDTDFQPLFLKCRLPGRRLAVMLNSSRGIAPGRVAQVELSSEGGRVALRMRAETSELSDLPILTGDMPFDPAVERMLTQGPALRISVGGTTDRIPLDGARQGAAALAAACRE